MSMRINIIRVNIIRVNIAGIILIVNSSTGGIDGGRNMEHIVTDTDMKVKGLRFLFLLSHRSCFPRS
jgi:hypothetical protein